MQASAFAGTLLALGLLSAPVFAQPAAPVSAKEPDTFALNWVRQVGAEECVSSTELAGLLQQLLGPVLRTPSQASLLVEGVVTRDTSAARWRAIIRVTDREGRVVGERELVRDGACAASTRSILLVLAVIIDPDSAERGVPVEVAEQLSALAAPRSTPANVASFDIPDRASSPPPIAPSPAETAPAPSPAPVAPVARDALQSEPPREAPAFATPRVSGGAAFGSGHVPGFNVGGVIDLGVAAGRTFHFDLGAWFWAPGSTTVTGPYTNGGSISFSAAQMTASLCYPIVRAAFEVSGCAGGMAGFRFIDAPALPQSGQKARAYFGPTLGADLTWFFGETWLARASVNAGYSVGEDVFAYQTHDGAWIDVFSPSPLLVWASLGIGARL